ncbi:glycosyltransferase family 39 protein [Streptomyces caniscabiei]|uniref:glycosyltransferase family 39 protein n=1 Tax=Streptomyces caniscabiei TaxID=2746961 RepID=UPI00299FE53D|nr:glycosyltransferase family 39 protein [Streptomyces caniscabiei]MDX2776589.1 glycosyltransferase family 39 protein [Streptomyces caniscabiei]
MIRSLLEKIGLLRRQSWGERHFLWVLGGSALLFAALSLSIGINQSVWFDEAYSIMLAKQPAAQLVHLTALDTHPPFYYLLLKGWATVFGWSELALRSLSVLAGALAIVFAGLTARRMFGARVALMALPFVTIAPFLIRYGFEIRMYALAALIGMMATYVLVRAWQAKPGQDQRTLYVVYALLVALGMYTLYYLAVLWIAHFLWLVWMSVRAKEPLKKVIKAPWFLAYLASIALFLPWLPAFLSQLGNGALAAISQPLTTENLVGIVSFEFLYRPSWQLGAVLSLVVVGVIALLVFLTIRAFGVVPTKQRPYLVLLAWYMLVPVLLVAAVSIFRPMYVERYLAHVAIGGMLYVGVIVALTYTKVARKIKVASLALLFVTMLGVMQLAHVGNYNFQRLQKPTVREAAVAVQPCAQGTTVFAADPYIAIELAYYLPDCQIYFYSQDTALRGGYASLSQSPLRISDPQKELAQSKQIQYVYYGDPALMLPPTLKQTLQADFGALHVRTLSAE